MTKNAILAAGALVCAALLLAVPPTQAQVKPGDHIDAANVARVKNLVSPGAYFAVSRGMAMNIVAPSPVLWPPPYKDATEKYSAQVELAPDHRNLLGYVAGQPFPLIDPNDPYVATKIMWNSYLRPIATDDADLRFFECKVSPFNPGGANKMLLLSEIGHAASYSEIGRTEVEPLPTDPDFKITGIWERSGAYPILQPSDEEGDGIIRYRYWAPKRGDDAWVFLGRDRRLRRLNEAIMSSSPGLNTWDADHVGGFAAKPQEYNYKFLGERTMLACAHAIHSPEQQCPTDGGATACPENWELRHMYIVEVTPRPRIAREILESKTIVYMDSEMWFNPYVDSYDRRGELWKTQIYLLTYRDRPVPDAKIAVYPFRREFVLAASSIDTQSGLASTCYLPGPDTPERECWYINMGAVDKDFFTTEAMARAGHGG